MYNEAKSREVSPKLVVRGKKYGRRSRPQSVAAFESSQSDSEEDYDFARVPTAGEKSKSYHKVSVWASGTQCEMHFQFLFVSVAGSTVGLARWHARH